MSESLFPPDGAPPQGRLEWIRSAWREAEKYWALYGEPHPQYGWVTDSVLEKAERAVR